MTAKKTKPRRLKKENIGQRLAQLRRDQGLTQQQLSDQTGISRRMIAHYETREASPPAHVLPKLAQTFGISVDDLLSLPKPNSGQRRRQDQAPQSTTDLRLWRKLQQIQKLPQQKRRALLQVLDGFLANAEEKK